MAYTLPPLPYAYNALEPHIDARTMEIHHTKHHQAYINNVNTAIAGSELEKLPVEKLIADRGLAVLAIGGNIVTSWSFFGVNQLGIGLHSYGFTSGIAIALDLFALSQFALIALGCVPTRLWWSYKAEQEPRLEPAG